jgi:hypothetical protein
LINFIKQVETKLDLWTFTGAGKPDCFQITGMGREDATKKAPTDRLSEGQWGLGW